MSKNEKLIEALTWAVELTGKMVELHSKIAEINPNSPTVLRMLPKNKESHAVLKEELERLQAEPSEDEIPNAFDRALDDLAIYRRAMGTTKPKRDEDENDYPF